MRIHFGINSVYSHRSYYFERLWKSISRSHLFTQPSYEASQFYIYILYVKIAKE